MIADLSLDGYENRIGADKEHPIASPGKVKTLKRKSKRALPVSQKIVTAAAKRPRITPNLLGLSPAGIDKIRQSFADGQYAHLGNKALRIYVNWKKYDTYQFGKVSPSDKSFLDTLLENLVQPKTLIKAIKLLASVSEHRQLETETEPALVSMIATMPSPEEVKEGKDHLASMVAAAKNAQTYLQGWALAPYEARLRLILAFVTLHITLNAGIAPNVRFLHDGWNETEIKVEKWRLFAEGLGVKKDQETEMQRLRDNVKYGKLLWSWVESCGVAWLVVFAAMDRGLVNFLRKNPRKKKRHLVIGSQLATSDTWVAFSKAFSGTVVRLLFTPSSPPLAINDLFRLYISQSNGTNAAFLFQDAMWSLGHRSLLYETTMFQTSCLSFDKAVVGTVFDVVGLEVPELPGSLVTLNKSLKINLIQWVVGAEETAMVKLKEDRRQDGVPISIPILDLASLFSSSSITASVFNFLTNLWDAGGINGWCCLSLLEGQCFMKSGGRKGIKDAMRVAINSKSSYDDIQHLLIPIETPTTYLLYYCCLADSTMSIFYIPDTPGIEGILKHSVKVG